MPEGRLKGRGQPRPPALPESEAARAVILRTLSEITSRAGLAARLGKSFSGDRDVYTAVGYPKTLTFDHFYSRYCRQDIARAVIDRPVRACWREDPEISETLGEETEFEKAWSTLAETARVFHALGRLDRLASIGKYAVLFMGFDDGLAPEQPVKRASRLLFVAPYSEVSAGIKTYDRSTSSARYGLPETYSLAVAEGTTDKTVTVHASRVIHVAEDLLESAVEGHPRLEAVYNRLQDLELILAGAAETFWRGGFPGYQFDLATDATAQAQDLTALQTEVENYMHGFQRYLRTMGVEMKAIQQQLADPTAVVAANVDMIAAATGIPKRILLGSERGELASSQDEGNWMKRIEERQNTYCEPMILRPLIDRLIAVGVLPTPAAGYSVIWPRLVAEGPREQAEIGEIQARALAAYISAPGADGLVPPEVALPEFVRMSPENMARIEAILKGYLASASGGGAAAEAEEETEEEGEEA